jgi:hypothetical protein
MDTLYPFYPMDTKLGGCQIWLPRFSALTGNRITVTKPEASNFAELSRLIEE